MTEWCLTIRFVNLLQAPIISNYHRVPKNTFVLYFSDMVKTEKKEKINLSRGVFWFSREIYV